MASKEDYEAGSIFEINNYDIEDKKGSNIFPMFDIKKQAEIKTILDSVLNDADSS